MFKNLLKKITSNTPVQKVIVGAMLYLVEKQLRMSIRRHAKGAEYNGPDAHKQEGNRSAVMLLEEIKHESNYGFDDIAVKKQKVIDLFKRWDKDTKSFIRKVEPRGCE